MARDYKKEYAAQKERGEHPRRMERQRARRAFDEEHAGSQTKMKDGKRVTNTASKRKGKDISHNKALSKGGDNEDGVRLESPSKNRARNYQRKK